VKESTAANRLNESLETATLCLSAPCRQVYVLKWLVKYPDHHYHQKRG
jgi:hypothetical protein